MDSEKLQKSLASLPPDRRLVLAQKWKNLAIAALRVLGASDLELSVAHLIPSHIDADKFCTMPDSQQVEKACELRLLCGRVLPDVAKIFQSDSNLGAAVLAGGEVESVSVWDVPEFSHVDDWDPDWLAASGLDEAAYQIRHLLYTEHCTDSCACEMTSERCLSPQSLCELILTMYRRYNPPTDVRPHAAMTPGYLYCMMDRNAAVRLVENAGLADTRRRAELAMDDRYRERCVSYMAMASEDLPDRALYGRRSGAPFQ